MSDIVIFVSSTGNYSSAFRTMKHLSLVGDTGYFDKEVNYAGSERPWLA